MTETADGPGIPQARRVEKKKRRVSTIWIIPIVAALVGLGIAVQRILSEGPEIRISFQTGEGIEAGKTVVKYKDIEIGMVTDVELTKDRKGILVTAEMEKGVEDMLDNDARFWVVKPRVTLSGVSGIGALISGNYIGFEPGGSPAGRRDFVGLETPPPVKRDRPGKEFVLHSGTLGSLGVGSPVYYRRLAVGEVVSYDLAKGGQSLEIRIFVNAPYDDYVTTNTRFWEASGLDVSAGAEGIAVKTESVTALLVGGIAFESPPADFAKEAAPGADFMLYKERKAAMAPTQAQVQRFTLYFRETLHGLSVGAPVAFLGLPVGEVSFVGMRYDPQTNDLRPLAEIMVYQHLFDEHIDAKTRSLQKISSRASRNEILQKLVVDRGLRAQLRTGSLISGQLYVGLDYFRDAQKARVDWKQDPPEFPVVPGGMTGIQEKVQAILAKLEKMPLDEIGEDVRKTLASLDNAVRGTGRTMERVEGKTLPELERALLDLRGTIDEAGRLMSNADNTLAGPDAPVRQELREALKEIARSARAIRLLADYLERNPGDLIRGKTQQEMP